MTANDVQNQMISFDELVATTERRWGIGRLVRLVSPETRAAVQRGYVLWNEAQANGDRAKIAELIPKLKQSWQVMEREAVKAGHQPLGPDTWEARAADGRVVIVAKTFEDAGAAIRQAQQDGRHVIVFALQEIANILPGFTLIDLLKREFPGALAAKTVTLPESYAESWTTRARGHDAWFSLENACAGREPVRDVEEVG